MNLSKSNSSQTPNTQTNNLSSLHDARVNSFEDMFDDSSVDALQQHHHILFLYVLKYRGSTDGHSIQVINHYQCFSS